ncbi:hypothetical protein NFI96_023199, partial [Prochilodus magdalenae]
DRHVKLSVEETSPYPGSVQGRGVNEDEDGDKNGRMPLHPIHDISRTTCLDKTIGIVVTCLCRSLTAPCRVFRCCGWHESVACDVKLSVEETCRNQGSTQPGGVDGHGIGVVVLHPVHDSYRTVPVYPWTDMQAD